MNKVIKRFIQIKIKTKVKKKFNHKNKWFKYFKFKKETVDKFNIIGESEIQNLQKES